MEQIFQTFTFAQVDVGPISMNTVGVGNKLFMVPLIGYLDHFDQPVEVTITFTPTVGSPSSVSKLLSGSIPQGYVYQPTGAPGDDDKTIIGFFAEGSGLVSVEIGTLITPPTTGSFTVFLSKNHPTP